MAKLRKVNRRPKPGDKARIIANNAGHSYSIGQIVTVGREYEYGGSWHCGSNPCPWASEDDLEVLEEANGFSAFMKRLDDVQTR